MTKQRKPLNLHMGLVEDFSRLFNEYLTYQIILDLKKKVALSLNIFLIKVCMINKKKIDDI